ncbi:MAG: 5-(carboxyamino)imidazole ribonucleotide synthase [Thermomicrobiales bacterium]
MDNATTEPHFDIGIIGAGQLARMMVRAAIPLGLRLRVLAQSVNDSAALVWPNVVVGSPDDPNTVLEFARPCGIVTFDHELVSPRSLDLLARSNVVLRPSVSTLQYAQNKRWQREEFSRRGFPVPAFAGVRVVDDVVTFVASYGWPVALKTAYGGYDGRGVWRIDNVGAAIALLESVSEASCDMLVERWIPIDREIALIVARSPSGQMATYPVVDTVQRDGICREIIAPADLPPQLSQRATLLGREIAEAIDLTGVMAVEYFVAGDELIINEIATRPHNSGHYTIEGSVTSQFEQHLRAVMDWPLGLTTLRSEQVVTVNVLGGTEAIDPREALSAALTDESVRVHLYGKSARPGRKLGHVTVTGPDLVDAQARAWRAAELLTGEPAEVRQ